MDNEIRLKLQLLQFADAGTARTLLAELEAQCRKNADAFEHDRITAGQFGASAKELQSAIRSVQSSLAQFDDAEDELHESLAQQVAAQIAAAESAERLAQAQREAATAGGGNEADFESLDRRITQEQQLAAALEAEQAAERDSAEAAARLRSVLASVETEARDAADSFQRGETTAREFADASRLLATDANRVEAELRQMGAAFESLDATVGRQARFAAALAEEEQAAQRAAQGSARLQSVLEGLEREQRELTDEVYRGTISQRDYQEQMQLLRLEADRTEQELRQLAGAADVEAGAMDRSAAASRRAGTAAHQVGTDLRVARQGALDVARGIQDFAQGGFGAILNNLEGLGRGIPALLKAPMALLTSLPTVLTLAGVALWQFGPAVYNAFRHFALGSNEIPKATDALGQIDGRLKEVTKQLDAYREAQTLTNKELADYNKLSAEQVILERQKKVALEEKQNSERAATANPAKEEEQKERVKLFDETIGTPQQREQLTQSVAKALPQDVQRKQLQDAIDRAKADQASQVFSGNEVVDQARSERLQRAVDAADSHLKRFNADIKAQAKKIVDQAVGGGVRADYEALQGLLANRPDAFTDLQAFQIRSGDVDAARTEKNFVEGQKRTAALDKDLKQKKEKDDREAAAQAKDERDFDAAANAEFARQSKEATQAVLKRDKSSGATDDSAKKIAEFAARRLGLKEDALFDYVQAEMIRVLTGEAAKKGVKTVDTKLIREASRQAAGRALGRQEKADEAEEKRDDKAEEQAENKARRERRETVKKSGLEARAGALYAEARARGGARGQGLTDDEATDYVGQQVLAYLNRQVGQDRRGKPVYANAGMSQDQKALLAAQIASQGKHEVQDQTKALAGQNLTNTGKLLAVSANLSSEVAQLEQKASEMTQRIDALGREVNARVRTGARR